VSPGWRPPERTAEGLRLIAEAETRRLERPEAFELDPETIALRISERAGKDIALPEGLARLAADIEAQDRLHALGRQTLAAMIGALALGGERHREYLEARPEIVARPIQRPIFIVGGWRTGTTLLHRMLATVPGLRAPLYWELSNPLEAAAAAPKDRKAHARRAQALHDFQYKLNPTKQVVHESGADQPEECVVAMGKDGLNWALTAPVWAPDYAAWLRTQDFTGSYRLHKETLQILAGSRPAARWVLKAPAHLAELSAILAVYPDAAVVHLHRDRLETVASGASLFAVFQATYSDRVDPLAIGAYQLDTYAFWEERAAAARRSPPPGAAPTFIDVAYTDLTADPIGTARDILSRADHALADDAPLAAFLEANRQHKLGRHRYAPEDFGLDEAKVRARFGAA